MIYFLLKGLVIITALRGLSSERLFVRQCIGLQRSLGLPIV